jgi:hypothetical protein
VEPCGATVAPCGSTMAPHGVTLITWLADLTTANIRAHNSRQNKRVRSVEQTTLVRPKQQRQKAAHQDNQQVVEDVGT